MVRTRPSRTSPSMACGKWNGRAQPGVCKQRSVRALKHQPPQSLQWMTKHRQPCRHKHVWQDEEMAHGFGTPSTPKPSPTTPLPTCHVSLMDGFTSGPTLPVTGQ